MYLRTFCEGVQKRFREPVCVEIRGLPEPLKNVDADNNDDGLLYGMMISDD